MEDSMGNLPSPPPLPPRPKLSVNTRRRIASEWLVRCSQTPSEERIGALMPYAGQYSRKTLYGMLADHLVSHNTLPSKTNLQELFLSNELSNRRRAASLQAHEVELEEADVLALVEWIEGRRTQNGHGPTWSEVKEHMGWSRNQVHTTLLALKREGWVTFGNRRNSLRAGPRISQ